MANSDHESSRMKNRQTRKASGRASALRVCHTIASTTNFKSRCPPCRMALRAAFEKCEQFTMHLRRLRYLLCLAPKSHGLIGCRRIPLRFGPCRLYAGRALV